MVKWSFGMCRSATNCNCRAIGTVLPLVSQIELISEEEVGTGKKGMEPSLALQCKDRSAIQVIHAS